MTFGKFKGQEIEDVPSSYLEWALGECTLTPEVIEEMENQLALRRGEGISRSPKR